MSRFARLRRSVALFICPVDGAAFIPGRLATGILRAVEGVLSPVVMAGPELEKRLRPHAERLCDISNPTLAERARRAAILWLIGLPETLPDTTEAAPRRSTTERDAALSALVLLLEKQTPPSGVKASRAEGLSSAVTDAPQAPAVPSMAADRGAH